MVALMTLIERCDQFVVSNRNEFDTFAVVGEPKRISCAVVQTAGDQSDQCDQCDQNPRRACNVTTAAKTTPHSIHIQQKPHKPHTNGGAAFTRSLNLRWVAKGGEITTESHKSVNVLAGLAANTTPPKTRPRLALMFVGFLSASSLFYSV